VSDVVLLHGWGSTPGVFDELSRKLDPYTPHALPLPESGSLDAAALDVAARAPRQCAVIGWSLGAQIAIRWACTYPQQVTRLVLMAATPSFVQRDDWPHGVHAEVFRAFSEELERDAPRTLRRFAALQTRADTHAKRVTHALRAAEANVSDVARLVAGLRILSGTDLREQASTISVPALVIHGENDTLVPRAAAEFLSRTMPGARCEIVNGAAHAPFMSDAARVSSRIADFLG
jgi:pimeloyl-[acyl-carrier protein] methyl ester esterase